MSADPAASATAGSRLLCYRISRFNRIFLTPQVRPIYEASINKVRECGP
jgi:hypothetical protein